MKLVLTEAALEDLAAISAYTRETWGEEQEEFYLKNLWSRFERLRSEFLRYRVREELFPGCRLAAEGRHVIFFRMDGEAVQVVRILHSAMDPKRHLGG